MLRLLGAGVRLSPEPGGAETRFAMFETPPEPAAERAFA
jgi:hypothetical protein